MVQLWLCVLEEKLHLGACAGGLPLLHAASRFDRYPVRAVVAELVDAQR
jgi:hypothetical protein